VPFSDGRALISFSGDLSISAFELRIGDGLADSAVEGRDRELLEALADLLRNARRSENIVLEQHGIVVLQRKREGRDWPSKAPFLMTVGGLPIWQLCQM
jgi:hypothetical protein